MTEEKAEPGIQWIMDLNKIDVVQSRAQIEALRAIAEELHELNEYFRSGDAAEDFAIART